MTTSTEKKSLIQDVLTEEGRSVLDEIIAKTEAQGFDPSRPRNYDELFAMANMIADGGMAAKTFYDQPEKARAKCAAAIAFGSRFGFDPFTSCQVLAIINGKPLMWGDPFKAVAISSGALVELYEDEPAVAIKQAFGFCRVKRVGSVECPKDDKGRCVNRLENNPVDCCIERRFTREMAEKARLWTKAGPWQDYPGRMLMMRARAWAIRDCIPDVMAGIYMHEEEGDVTSVPLRPRALPGSTLTPEKVQSFIGGPGRSAAPPVKRPQPAAEPSPASAAARTAPERAAVLRVEKQTQQGMTWWDIDLQFQSEKKTAKTKDAGIAKKAESIINTGLAALVSLSLQKGQREYWKIESFEAEQPPATQDPQPDLPMEPGSNG